jgi:Lysozyme like domain
VILAPLSLVTTFQAAGFPHPVAETMAAIAMRESGGDPMKVNNTPATGDYSFGLVQINWGNDDVRAFLQANGFGDPFALLDSATTARAAFLLWRGKNAYLDLLWYIRKGGAYQSRYEANLLIVHEAVLAAVTLPQPAS